MGWLRLVGSFKLQVSFAEYSLFCQALLQKRPVILRSLLIVAIPHVWVRYTSVTWYVWERHILVTISYGVINLFTYEWVTSHIWMSHVTHVNNSCHAYIYVWERHTSVTWYVWERHALVTISYGVIKAFTYERVTSHIWISHVTHMNESCHTHESFMSHV